LASSSGGHHWRHGGRLPHRGPVYHWPLPLAHSYTLLVSSTLTLLLSELAAPSRSGDSSRPWQAPGSRLQRLRHRGPVPLPLPLHLPLPPLKHSLTFSFHTWPRSRATVPPTSHLGFGRLQAPAPPTLGRRERPASSLPRLPRTQLISSKRSLFSSQVAIHVSVICCKLISMSILILFLNYTYQNKLHRFCLQYLRTVVSTIKHKLHYL
jgi:hypothetical protein